MSTTPPVPKAANGADSTAALVDAANRPGRPHDDRPDNRLLRALPAAELALLQPHLERFELQVMEVLAEADAPLTHVYFPEHGVISVVRRLQDGTLIEAGTVGCEGVAGVGVLIGEAWSTSTLTGQIPGPALRLPFDTLHAQLPQLPVLRDLIARYALAMMDQTAQTIACNTLHSVDRRCVRWLLTAHDRVASDEFLLTHEVLSQMLGVRRAGVTEAAGALQRAGYITYSRGRVRVRDRAGLEAAACECYGIVQRHYARLLGHFGGPQTDAGAGA